MPSFGPISSAPISAPSSEGAPVPPIPPIPIPTGAPNLNTYTIMRASTINISAPIAAPINLTGNLL